MKFDPDIYARFANEMVRGLAPLDDKPSTVPWVLENDGHGAWEETDLEALGMDPRDPTNASPGSDEKVEMLAARYAAGMPLWHANDCSDHELAGNQTDRQATTEAAGSFVDDKYELTEA